MEGGGHKHHKRNKEEVRISTLTDPRWNEAPVVFIGIDDTDNLESRGTGFRARQLAEQLQAQGLARLRGVTRHQLFVSPDIPYTSHNSSACLEMNSFEADRAALIEWCRDYLLRESAVGSDAGLCVARAAEVTTSVQDFGLRAKVEVLKMDEAFALAQAQGIFLEGLTGTHQGIIGALSGVGLHATRNDGRFLWMRGVRDLAPGAYLLGALRGMTDIEAFMTTGGEEIAADVDTITITDWARPVFTGGRSVLFLEEENHEQSGNRWWRVAAKEFIKRY